MQEKTGEEIVALSEQKWATQAKNGGKCGRCEWCALICNMYGYSAWRWGNTKRSRGETPLVCAPCPIVTIFGRVCTAIPEYQAWRPEHREYSNVPPYVKITPLGQEASQAVLELIQNHRAELVRATDELLEKMKGHA